MPISLDVLLGTRPNFVIDIAALVQGALVVSFFGGEHGMPNAVSGRHGPMKEDCQCQSFDWLDTPEIDSLCNLIDFLTKVEYSIDHEFSSGHSFLKRYFIAEERVRFGLNSR